MAEPIWESFITVNKLGTSPQNIVFDFLKYKYRMKNISISYSPQLIKHHDAIGRYPVMVFSMGANSTVEVFDGFGWDAKLTNGINYLSVNAGDKIIFERMLLWTPPNLKANINGATKEFDKGWVNVNGELKEIDKMWTNINGVLREV